MLLGLLAIGFLGVVGIAIATPSVATSVGLGDVTPFVVPGAAAPPPAKAPTAPVQTAKPKPKARPARVTAPEPVAPAPQPAPSHDEPIADPTNHDDKPLQANHNDQPGDHGKHSDHGRTNPPSGQTDDHGLQSNPTGQTEDQTSQNQQDALRAPVQAGTPRSTPPPQPSSPRRVATSLRASGPRPASELSQLGSTRRCPRAKSP